MELPRRRVLGLIETKHGADAAAAAQERLDDPVDLERDADLLGELGVDPVELGGPELRPTDSAQRVTGHAVEDPGAEAGTTEAAEPDPEAPDGSGSITRGIHTGNDTLEDVEEQPDRGTAP